MGEAASREEPEDQIVPRDHELGKRDLDEAMDQAEEEETFLDLFHSPKRRTSIQDGSAYEELPQTNTGDHDTSQVDPDEDESESSRGRSSTGI